MWLFSKKKQVKQIAPNTVYNWWTTEPLKEVIDAPEVEKGFESYCFYLYNNEPLKGKRIGSNIVVSPIAGDVLLYNPSDGASIDTGKKDMIAYSYNGQPIGMSGFCRDGIRELLMAGYRINIKAKIVNEYGTRSIAFFCDESLRHGLKLVQQ